MLTARLVVPPFLLVCCACAVPVRPEKSAHLWSTLNTFVLYLSPPGVSYFAVIRMVTPGTAKAPELEPPEPQNISVTVRLTGSSFLDARGPGSARQGRLREGSHGVVG